MSSANNIESSGKSSVKSLMKIMNSKGPKIEPCGTPDVSELYPENELY